MVVKAHATPSVLAHTGPLTITYNSSSRKSNALFQPPWVPTHMCTYMYIQHKHNKNFLFFMRNLCGSPSHRILKKDLWVKPPQQETSAAIPIRLNIIWRVEARKTACSVLKTEQQHLSNLSILLRNARLSSCCRHIVKQTQVRGRTHLNLLLDLAGQRQEQEVRCDFRSSQFCTFDGKGPQNGEKKGQGVWAKTSPVF